MLQSERSRGILRLVIEPGVGARMMDVVLERFVQKSPVAVMARLVIQ
jgi:hypothetical protein